MPLLEAWELLAERWGYEHEDRPLLDSAPCRYVSSAHPIHSNPIGFLYSRMVATVKNYSSILRPYVALDGREHRLSLFLAGRDVVVPSSFQRRFERTA